MDSVDLEVLKRSADWLDAGRRVLLVTVVKTWGSSPRPEGAMLAVRDDGLVVGSVSGGCIEDDLIDRTRRLGMTQTVAEAVTYGVSADEARRFGLPCGGTIQLVVEPLTRASGMRALLREIEAGHLVARRLDLVTGDDAAPGAGRRRARVRRHGAATIHGPHRMLVGASRPPRVPGADRRRPRLQVTITRVARECRRDVGLVQGVRSCARCPTIYGEGHADSTALRGGGARTIEKLDVLALMEALKSPAFYVGALGSRVNNAKRRERLVEFDVTPEEIERLHGPIGLFIGSRTPPEIAISILAEITAVKNGVDLPAAAHVSAAKARIAASAACPAA